MELMQPINGVFLDIGWTLLEPTSGSWFFSHEILSMLENIAPDRVKAAQEQASRLLEKNHIVLNEDEEYRQFYAFYQCFFEQLPECPVSPEQIKRLTEEKVYNDEIYTFFSDTKETIVRLQQTYKLGIISDTWPSIVRVLSNHGIWDAFDAVTLSCDLGTWKPNERMYQDALEKMNLPAKETVFVDDSVNNVLGAQKLGIQPILITVNPKTKPDDRVICIDRISALVGALGTA